MAAYALIELEITNMEGLAPYVAAVSDTLAAHGGRYLVRPGPMEVVEGGVGDYPTKVVLEFPSMAAAHWVNWTRVLALPAATCAERMDGTKSATRTPMTAMTDRSSSRVKPRRCTGRRRWKSRTDSLIGDSRGGCPC